MIHLKIFLILPVIALLSASCIREEMSGCRVDTNTVITFEYSGDTDDPGMFGKNIDKVSLFVFDDTGVPILEKNIESTALHEFQGTELYLEQGRYKIVSWANAKDNTEILLNGNLSDGRVHAVGYGSGKTIRTNDHLYYGEVTVDVPEEATIMTHGALTVTADMHFRSAHINIEVYIKGFGQQNMPETYPIVTADNLMPEYNMLMEPASEASFSYTPEVSWNEEKNMAEACFSVLRFSDDNDIVLSISDPVSDDNETNAEISLKEYMAGQGISVDNKQEATVQVLFEFTDLGVEVGLPDWESSDVTPEI